MTVRVAVFEPLGACKGYQGFFVYNCEVWGRE